MRLPISLVLFFLSIAVSQSGSAQSLPFGFQINDSEIEAEKRIKLNFDRTGEFSTGEPQGLLGLFNENGTVKVRVGVEFFEKRLIKLSLASPGIHEYDSPELVALVDKTYKLTRDYFISKYGNPIANVEKDVPDNWGAIVSGAYLSDEKGLCFWGGTHDPKLYIFLGENTAKVNHVIPKFKEAVLKNQGLRYAFFVEYGTLDFEKILPHSSNCARSIQSSLGSG